MLIHCRNKAINAKLMHYRQNASVRNDHCISLTFSVLRLILKYFRLCFHGNKTSFTKKTQELSYNWNVNLWQILPPHISWIMKMRRAQVTGDPYVHSVETVKFPTFRGKKNLNESSWPWLFYCRPPNTKFNRNLSSSFRDEICGWTERHSVPIMRSFYEL
jgi:hypothetical protein